MTSEICSNSTTTGVATPHASRTPAGTTPRFVPTASAPAASGSAGTPAAGAEGPVFGPVSRVAGVLMLCLCSVGLGCEDPGTTPGPTSGTTWVTSDAPMAAQVQQVVDALAAETSGGQRQQDAWHDRVRAELARMETADPDLGRAVLVLLDEREDFDPALRGRLLDAASRAMAKEPEANAELATFLASRIETYGRPLGERNQACELLGRHCPEAAVTLLAPLLLPDRRATTLPDREFMLRGYLEGARATDTDPYDLLCEIALEQRIDHITRKTALRELVPIATPRAISVFETVMTESSGDSLIRGVAIHCYMETVETERAIEHLQELSELEADINMQILLANALASLRGER